MSSIRKLAWYGSSVAVAAILAVALVTVGASSTANAATVSAASVNVGSTVTVTETTNTTEEVQTIAAGNRTGGTHTLTYSGETTAAISCTATAAQIETALEALGNITDVAVGGGPLGTAAVTVTFEEYTGSVSGDPPQLVIGNVAAPAAPPTPASARPRRTRPASSR